MVEAKYPPVAASKIAAAIRIHFCMPEPEGAGVLKTEVELLVSAGCEYAIGLAGSAGAETNAAGFGSNV